MRFLFFISILFLFSCKVSEKETLVGVQAKNIEFTVLKEGTNSGHKTAGSKIIHNTEELSLAWTILHGNYMENPPIPKIDFNSNQLILILMGEKTSGGYSIGVENIIEINAESIITIGEKKPGKTCMTTSVMTYPYQLIIIPKTNKQIVYKRIERLYECGKE